MPKLMMTLRLDPKEATLTQVRRKLKLKKGEIDQAFGVVLLDPSADLYAILVSQEASERLQGVSMASGPYSNARIEPFGPQ